MGNHLFRRLDSGFNALVPHGRAIEIEPSVYGSPDSCKEILCWKQQIMGDEDIVAGIVM